MSYGLPQLLRVWLLGVWRARCALLVVGAALLVVTATLVVAPLAHAGSTESGEEQARRAQDISRTTMSPFCPGRTIDACPSEYATQWREDIRAWIAEGVSTDEIKRRLKERTDHDLTGAPSTMLDGVLPYIVVVLSGLTLALLLRALLKPGKGTAERAPKKVATAGDARALDARLDDELRNMDE